MSVYAAELANIENEMKRLRARLKELRALRQKPAEALYRYMAGRNLSLYQGIRLDKIAPRPVGAPRKTPSQKKRDALEFFRNAGVGDPETFYKQYLLTQKPLAAEEGGGGRGPVF